MRKDIVCQDALFLVNEENFVAACVADGHGSSSCPYSDEGAKIAVKLASELFVKMLPNLSDHKDIWLPKQIESEWKKEVLRRHVEAGRDMPNEDEPFPYILYGTTLLALVAADSFVFALQIGDGNILVTSGAGEARFVFPEPERQGEETESLCMADAWQFVHTQIIPWSASGGPRMFLLCTDGYSNSFTSSAGFLKAGSDFFDIWKEEGLSMIEKELPEWLRQSSDKGSGDDIALAVVVYE